MPETTASKKKSKGEEQRRRAKKTRKKRWIDGWIEGVGRIVRNNASPDRLPLLV